MLRPFSTFKDNLEEFLMKNYMNLNTIPSTEILFPTQSFSINNPKKLRTGGSPLFGYIQNLHPFTFLSIPGDFFGALRTLIWVALPSDVFAYACCFPLRELVY